jgi:hypothetical protein
MFFEQLAGEVSDHCFTVETSVGDNAPSSNASHRLPQQNLRRRTVLIYAPQRAGIELNLRIAETDFRASPYSAVEVVSMNYKGVLKRLLPFAATFFVAVFITSFFVDLHRPRFGEWRGRGFHEMQRLRFENEQLRNENLSLRNELENRRTDSGIGGSSDIEGLKLMVPAPPLSPPSPRVLKLRHSTE